MKGADNIVEMKIGSGTKNGEKIRGYAPRCGKSLCELLKQNGEINIKSMGGAATNNAVKAIAHAQNLYNIISKKVNKLLSLIYS